MVSPTSPTVSRRFVLDLVNAIITNDLKLPVAPGDLANIPLYAMAPTWYWSGVSRKALTDLLRSVDCRWFEDNGVIRIIRRGTLANVGPGVLISDQTGMLESPKPTEHGIKVRSLHLPRAQLGSQVEVRSRFVNGFWKLNTITHDITNRANGKFETLLELLPVEDADTAIQTAQALGSDRK